MPLSTIKEDGGPAFPPVLGKGSTLGDDHQGMSLRDWFAGQAVGEMIRAARNSDDDIPYSHDLVAAWSYALADAMLEARKK